MLVAPAHHVPRTHTTHHPLPHLRRDRLRRPRPGAQETHPAGRHVLARQRDAPPAPRRLLHTPPGVLVLRRRAAARSCCRRPCPPRHASVGCSVGCEVGCGVGCSVGWREPAGATWAASDGWPVGRDVGWLDGWPVGCWVGWPRRLARRLLGRLARAACPCATVAAWAPPCFATWAGVVGGPWAAAWACRDGWRDVDWRDGQAGGHTAHAHTARAHVQVTT